MCLNIPSDIYYLYGLIASQRDSVMNVETQGNCIGLRGFEGLKDLLTLMQRILLNFTLLSRFNNSLLDGLFAAVNRLQENFRMTLYDLLLNESKDFMNGSQL